MNDRCSNYTAKATTILQKVKYILKQDEHHQLIFTDSLNVLSSLQNRFDPSEITVNTENSINKQNKKKVLIYVPEHTNIEGNKIVGKTFNQIAQTYQVKIQIQISTDIKIIDKKYSQNKMG